MSTQFTYAGWEQETGLKEEYLQLDVLIISSQDLAHYRTVTVFADLQDLPTSSAVEWELQHIGSRSMFGTGKDKWGNSLASFLFWML